MYHGGSGTARAVVPQGQRCCGGGGAMVTMVLQRLWHNRLNGRELLTETQTVGKHIDKPLYRQTCVQYFYVTSSSQVLISVKALTALLFSLLCQACIFCFSPARRSPSHCCPEYLCLWWGSLESGSAVCARDGAQCVAAPGCNIGAGCLR